MGVAFNIRLIWILDTILRGSASLFDIPVQYLVSILAKICTVFWKKNCGNLYPLIPKYLYVDEKINELKVWLALAQARLSARWNENYQLPFDKVSGGLSFTIYLILLNRNARERISELQSPGPPSLPKKPTEFWSMKKQLFPPIRKMFIYNKLQLTHFWQCFSQLH